MLVVPAERETRSAILLKLNQWKDAAIARVVVSRYVNSGSPLPSRRSSDYCHDVVLVPVSWLGVVKSAMLRPQDWLQMQRTLGRGPHLEGRETETPRECKISNRF